MSIQIDQIITMSTLHLTQSTMEKIFYDECASISFCNTFGYGFIVRFIPGESYYGEDYDDLADCIDYANERGCAYIRFDDDGPIFLKLPRYTAGTKFDTDPAVTDTSPAEIVF